MKGIIGLTVLVISVSGCALKGAIERHPYIAHVPYPLMDESGKVVDLQNITLDLGSYSSFANHRVDVTTTTKTRQDGGLAEYTQTVSHGRDAVPLYVGVANAIAKAWAALVGAAKEAF